VEIPTYRTDPAGRGVVTFENDRTVFLGPAGDPASVANYDLTVSAWLAAGRRFLEPAVASGPMPFDAFVAEMLDTVYSPATRSLATRRKMVHAAKVLVDHKVKTTADLDVRLIGRVVAERSAMNHNSLRSLLREISAICTYAQETGRIPVSPFLTRKVNKWVRASPPLPERSNHLTALEVTRLLELLTLDVAERRGYAGWCARRLQALVALVCYTGMRLGEALWLQVVDVDLVERVIEIVDRPGSHELKTLKASAPVICPHALVPILTDWLLHRDDSPRAVVRPPSVYVFRNWRQASPWTGGPPGHKPLQRLRAVAARCGIEGVTFQALRRTVATMMESTCSEAMITRQLRHSTQSTTKKFYRKADIARMKESMDGFSYGQNNQ
jgi:integrase